MLSTGNISSCPKPTINESEIKFKPSKTITGNALKEFSRLPGVGLEALSPEHSLFLIGKNMLKNPSGDHATNRGIALLLMAASPVVAIAKAVFSVGAAGAGVIGTAILAPSYAVEKGVRMVIDSDKLDNPKLKREAL